MEVQGSPLQGHAELKFSRQQHQTVNADRMQYFDAYHSSGRTCALERLSDRAQSAALAMKVIAEIFAHPLGVAENQCLPTSQNPSLTQVIHAGIQDPLLAFPLALAFVKPACPAGASLVILTTEGKRCPCRRQL